MVLGFSFSLWITYFKMGKKNRRPTALQDRRDSDDDDYQDRDYDVAALANNLSQAFRYGMYSNDDIDEVCFIAFEVHLHFFFLFFTL